MKKYTSATLNMILALGVVCILAGILFFVRVALSVNMNIEAWSIVLCVSGAVVFYISLAALRHVALFFIGLYSCVSGAFFMVVTSSFVESGLERFWPIVVILAGICIIFTGIAKDRRLKISCLIPASCIIFLGCFFLFFSMNIIKMNFSSWISIFWPIFPLFVGTVLVIVFLFQKSPYNKFPLDEESTIDFDGDVKA